LRLQEKALTCSTDVSARMVKTRPKPSVPRSRRKPPVTSWWPRNSRRGTGKLHRSSKVHRSDESYSETCLVEVSDGKRHRMSLRQLQSQGRHSGRSTRRIEP